MISIVTPVYNEEDNVIFFHDAVTRVMEETGMAYELIYVDDGSHDRTNELICGLAEKDPHVRALNSHYLRHGLRPRRRCHHHGRRYAASSRPYPHTHRKMERRI